MLPLMYSTSMVHLQRGSNQSQSSSKDPHLSKDARSDPALYNMLRDSMQPICPIFRDLLLKHLPSFQTRLSAFCDLLLLNYTPPAHPFPGLVKYTNKNKVMDQILSMTVLILVYQLYLDRPNVFLVILDLVICGTITEQ
jgi:hypothetical protein